MAALGASIPAVVFDPPEPLLLRDRDHNLLDYRDTENTRGIRKRVAEINEALRSAAAAHPECGVVIDGAPITLGKSCIGPARRTLHRGFTVSFSLHGRFYGGWWLGIPKRERERLILNGEPTFEADYPRLHITLVYAEGGVPLDGDPYDVGGRWPRPFVKTAVNIMLNAADYRSARGALAK